MSNKETTPLNINSNASDLIVSRSSEDELEIRGDGGNRNVERGFSCGSRVKDALKSVLKKVVFATTSFYKCLLSGQNRCSYLGARNYVMESNPRFDRLNKRLAFICLPIICIGIIISIIFASLAFFIDSEYDLVFALVGFSFFFLSLIVPVIALCIGRICCANEADVNVAMAEGNQ